MFSTSFGGGYQSYSQRENAVSRANKERQKSQKISQATAGKKRARKEENKGKHRDKSKSETTITSGSERQGGSGFGVVNVISAKAPNRKGAGRPKTISGVGGVRRGLETAFGTQDTTRERGVRSEARERELEAEQRRREERLERRSAAELEQQRRDRGERQRQFNRTQQAEQAREATRERERREDIRDRAQERADRAQAEQERADAQERRFQEAQQAFVVGLQQQGQRPLIAGPLIVGPLVAEGAIVNAPKTNFSNIGNVGTDATSRRRRRGIGGRGGGGGGRRSYGSSSDSSSSSSSSPSAGQPDPTPRTRRERGAQSAQSRQRPQRSPSIPTTPAEEQSLLAQGAGALLTGATTLGGGLARAGGGFVGGIGGAIAEQLPTAEAVGNIAGRGVVAVGGATAGAVASGAQTLLREALRPTQQEQKADPALLQSVSEGESVVVEPQQPVRTLAERNQDRIDAETRRVAQEQEEIERNRRIREERRRSAREQQQQKAVERTGMTLYNEQAGILADIQANAGRVVGAVVGSLNLAREALSAPTLQQRESISTELRSDEGFSSGGEQAGQVLVREGEEQGAFRETYISPQDETDAQRRERAQREQREAEREELERQTARAPTPAQVRADVASGNEGLFRQFSRIVQTGGDVLEDPVETPESPTTIQRLEDEQSARQLQQKEYKDPLQFPKEPVEPIKKKIKKRYTPRPPRARPVVESDSESETDIRELKRIERERIYNISIKQGKSKREARLLSRLGTRYLGGSSSSEAETSPDEEAKFRDIKTLSPKQLEQTAIQLQRQQIDADRRLADTLGEEGSGRPSINLLAEVLDSDSSSGGASRRSSSGGERSGSSSGGSQGEDYNFANYRQDDY
jgi:hypothetical protein